MSNQLDVYLDGTPVGMLTQSPQGALGFSYDDTYRSGTNPTPLSMSMPLHAPRHTNRVVRAFLDGLLPDNEAVRERWGATFGVSANNPFALLRHVGRDAAGAIQILPDGQGSDDAAERSGHIEWLTDDDLHSILRDLATHGSDWNAGRRTGRWSLAGAQSKVALYRDPATGRWGIPQDSTPTTHIIKPAINGLDDHHVNETLCQRAAANLGLLAAATELVEVGDVQAIISSRYDRFTDRDGRLRRLHQEDLCQALSVHPTQKYQSDGGPGVGRIADLFTSLDLADRRVSAQRFFDGLAYNVLIGGTDGHAKNYSMMLAGRRAQLAPLYDLASAAPYTHGDVPQRDDSPAASAMKVGDHWIMKEITGTDWARTGQRLGIGAEQAIDRVAELRRRLPGALLEAVESLPPSVHGRGRRIADQIDAHTATLAVRWGGPF